MRRSKSPSTSWQSSSDWYDRLVGKEGHYYHRQVILPGVLRLLSCKPGDKILDLACGQGILARALPSKIDYLGIDISPALIRSAKAESRHRFLVQDLTRPLSLPEKNFTHATLILALQNIADGPAVLQSARSHLVSSGTFLIVLNHPCFRIPRQTSWQIDAERKVQYRRVDRYLSPLEIPLQTHPGKASSPETWSFHYPLSTYTQWLHEAGFVIETLEEWCSDKKSTGKHAKMEDRSRKEFPLFLTIVAKAR